MVDVLIKQGSLETTNGPTYQQCPNNTDAACQLMHIPYALEPQCVLCDGEGYVEIA